MTTTFTCNGNDISLASIGGDIRKFGVTIGNWVHIVGVNGDGSLVYQGNRSVDSEDIPLLHFGSSDVRLFANGTPYVSERLGEFPIVGVTGNDPRRFVHGDPQVDSPYVATKDDYGWKPLFDGENSIPHVVCDKFIPVLMNSGDDVFVSQEFGDIVVRSVTSDSVSEHSRLAGFRLVDALPYGNDILVFAVWVNGGYPRQALAVDAFNGQEFTFWRHAPFVFVLRESESFAYFNSFSSSNSSPFPLISMNSPKTNSMSTNGKDVYVTSVVRESGKWKQAVSYCSDGGSWDMMNEAIFPFEEFSSVAAGSVCDVSYDGISGDPIAMFLSGGSVSIRFFDPTISKWKNWRGYNTVCWNQSVDEPPPTSSSSSSSCSSSSCSSSSSSFSSSSYSSSSYSLSSSSSSFMGAVASSCPGGNPEVSIMITSVDANLPITWCGITWLKSTTPITSPATERHSGDPATICPTAYYKGTWTSFATTYSLWSAYHIWRNGLGSLELRREAATLKIGARYYRDSGLYFPQPGRNLNTVSVKGQKDFIGFFGGFTPAVYSRPVPITYTQVPPYAILSIGMLTGVTAPEFTNYNITGAWFGNFSSGGVTYSWSAGLGW